MKIVSFALGMLAVSTQALETLDFTADESQNIMAGFSMWNCSTCTLAFAGLDRILRNEKVEGAIEAVATKVCEIGDIVAGGDTVCPDAVRQYAPDLFDAAVRNLLSKDRMCNQVLGLCKNPVIEEIFLKNVVDDILSTKPTSLANDDFINKLYAEITADKNEREIIRAVHISDVHIDKEYLSGSKAKCDSFLCCRAESGTPAPGDILAGDWGSNAGLCDLPVKTFESLMENVVNVQKPDILFWTGDNSPHNIWDNTMEEVTDYTKSVTDIIKNAIKDSDITVIPIHGNHDTWPVDEQDFSTPNSNYPINHIKEYWSDWLGDAKDKYGEYGYYSKDLTLKNGKALPAGSKVIAINTNSCDAINFYMWGERSDPGNQFEWLELQLAQIEANNGIALMLGHYTPSSCQHQWGVRYRALMERFQNVVRFGLVGHTHEETYQLSNSMTNPEKPVLLTTVGGSVTTYDFNNPSFMVIDLDAKTLLPINMKTFYIDVEEANRDGQPTWKEQHDYKTSYGVADLSPVSMKDLAVRILTNRELATQFEFNESRQDKYRDEKLDQLSIYCDLVTSEQHEQNWCNQSANMSAYGKPFKILSKNFGKAVVDRIIGNWVKYSINQN